MRINVTVITLNLAKATAQVRDKSLGVFEVAIRQRTLLRLPVEGEIWTIYQQGNIWYFDEPYAVADFAGKKAGDTVIATEGALAIEATGLTLNGSTLGYWHSDSFTSNGGGTYNLAALPTSAYPVVHYGVDRLHPSQFTISGTTLTIPDDFATGVPITAVYETAARIYSDSASVQIFLDVAAVLATS